MKPRLSRRDESKVEKRKDTVRSVVVIRGLSPLGPLASPKLKPGSLSTERSRNLICQVP